MAAEAKAISCMHQTTIFNFLKAEKDAGKETKYGELVEEMEKHHCDTVGAMLRILKKRKVIKYEGLFLMFPAHKDYIITLRKDEYNAESY